MAPEKAPRAGGTAHDASDTDATSAGDFGELFENSPSGPNSHVAGVGRKLPPEILTETSPRVKCASGTSAGATWTMVGGSSALTKL